MKIERSQLFAITSILDRNGKRVGNYLVERSKDSLNREQRDSKKSHEEEAVVVHTAEGEPNAEKSQETDVKTFSSTSNLDITV